MFHNSSCPPLGDSYMAGSSRAQPLPPSPHGVEPHEEASSDPGLLQHGLLQAQARAPGPLPHPPVEQTVLQEEEEGGGGGAGGGQGQEGGQEGG